MFLRLHFPAYMFLVENLSALSFHKQEANCFLYTKLY